MLAEEIDMTLKLVYKIGADPELFVQDVKSGSFVSAHNLVPGSKIQPHRVTHGAIQPDGTSAEFNIDPATNVQDFKDNIRSVLLELQEAVNRTRASQGKTDPVQLKVQPTAYFDPKYFKDLPRMAKAFGCTPDWNAWTEKPTEFEGTEKPFRTGAGHVHVGWTNNQDTNDPAHFFDCTIVTKQLDALLYIPSLLWDNDRERRLLYGRIGAFRPKPYGVEYRVLSNAWVADPALHEFVFNTSIRAMQLLDGQGFDAFEHNWAKAILSRGRNNGPVTRNEVVAYHKKMVDDYNLPHLPAKYVGV